MSKIYQVENQVILRLPIEIARKVNQVMESKETPEGGAKEQTIELLPYPEKDGIEPPRFQFRYGDFVSRATLMELPNIIESQKTLDYINYLKSNDISQMIYVHPNNEDHFEKVKKSRRIARKIISKDPYRNMNTLKFLARDGLTSPTKCIRTRFFRKKIYFDPQDAREVEKSFQSINQELTKGNKKDQNAKQDNEDGDEVSSNIASQVPSKGGKRRYRKKEFYK